MYIPKMSPTVERSLGAHAKIDFCMRSLKDELQETSCESQETIGELKPTGGNRKIDGPWMYVSE